MSEVVFRKNHFWALFVGYCQARFALLRGRSMMWAILSDKRKETLELHVSIASYKTPIDGGGNRIRLPRGTMPLSSSTPLYSYPDKHTCL